MKCVSLKGKKSIVKVGNGYPIAVNVNIGVSSSDKKKYEVELDKVRILSDLCEKPDLIMDLSLCCTHGYLYEDIREWIGCPIGFIPHYLCLNNKNIIDKVKLKEEMIRAASNGVSWFVIHLTPTLERVHKAIRLRRIPFSSRSAVIIIKDMVSRNAEKSIYWDILEDIVEIAKKYSITISLGAAFRPAVTKDTLDEVHLEELNEYNHLIKIFHKEGISVIAEGVGHCSPHKLRELISVVNKLNVPFMPLGPLFKDDFLNDDHIVNAIGFYSAVSNGGHFNIVNSITPTEHSGGIPDINNILVGYSAARSCANLCNNYLGLKLKSESINKCSVIEGNNIGCNRCDRICPTKYFVEEREKIERWIHQDLIY